MGERRLTAEVMGPNPILFFLRRRENSVSFMEDKRAIIGGTIMTDMMNMLMTNYYWVEVILAVGMAIYYGPKCLIKSNKSKRTK